MIPFVVLPLRRELDAESLRLLHVAWLRRQFRQCAAVVVELEARVVEESRPAWHAVYARKLRDEQERLMRLREALR